MKVLDSINFISTKHDCKDYTDIEIKSTVGPLTLDANQFQE